MQKKVKLTAEEKKELKRLAALENERAITEGWADNSNMGKNKYALRFGLLTWGLPTFVLYSVIMLILNLFVKSGMKYDLIQASFALVFFCVFGIFYGRSLWKKNEKIYRNKYPYGKKATKK